MGTDFRQMLTEQKEERRLFTHPGFIPRETDKLLNVNSRLAQIITGVRRSGKSTLAHRGLSGLNYAYVNFDDERLAGIEAGDLDLLLETLFSLYGDFQHILLDEIQNVEHWHLFVNRLLRNNLHVVLTGSNSKLLATEFATHLTGRYTLIELMPFSFTEFLLAKGISSQGSVTAKDRGIISGLFLQYLQQGGFPDIILGEQDPSYIRNLFEAIVTRDIIFRHKIRQIRAFRETASYLSYNFASPLSYNRLKNMFSLGSENTSKNYVSYLEEAFLILTLQKFSYKNQESTRNRKAYLVDTAFATIGSGTFTPNIGRLLENAVFLELYRRSHIEKTELFFYKSNLEVDFLIYNELKVKELIQVCQSVSDDRVLEREVRALIAAAKDLNTKELTILTLDETREFQKNGYTIRILPVWEWMMAFWKGRPE